MGGIGQNILREIKEEGDELKAPSIKEILQELENQVIKKNIKKKCKKVWFLLKHYIYLH